MDKVLIEKIIVFRAKHNLSQENFAKMCCLTQQTICNIENGRQDPSKITKQKILNVIKKEGE